MRRSWPLVAAIVLLATALTLSVLRAAEDRAASVAGNLGWSGSVAWLTVAVDASAVADGRGFLTSPAVASHAGEVPVHLGIPGARFAGTVPPGTTFGGTRVDVLVGAQPHLRGAGTYLWALPHSVRCAST